MSFISFEFILFFIALMLLYSLLRQEKHRQILLLVSSYFFYGCADVRFLVMLIVISVLIWYIGLKSENRKNRGFYILGILICLGVLGYFKYCNFFIESFATLLRQKSFGTLQVILPLGISFYIFQAISYLCDVHWGKIAAEKEVWKVLLYVGFFPQITSGPIVKAKDFLPQLQKEHRITWSNFSAGLQKATIGLFKKVVIADRLGVVVDAVYAAPKAYSGFSLLMAACSYAIQIYCDFSGYSDMAIGVAEILGYDLGKNFELPYIARNPSDFWRRWHISLSSWFRDYVYIPLGGNRKGNFRTYFNLFVTMLLSGLWHGANWTFVIWGAFHGGASAIHKVFSDIRKKGKSNQSENMFGHVVSVTATIALVWLLWIPFRVSTFRDAVVVISRILVMAEGIRYISAFSIIYIILIMFIQIYAVVTHDGKPWWKPLNFTKFWQIFLFAGVIMAIVVFAYIGDTAFIYAQF